MAFGLGVLRLPPHEFWAMTPREIGAALEGVYGVRPKAMNQAALNALMKRFPDR